ncbi:MAG: hypothetical protein ACLQVM_02155 [Terriglobia bacterium]
MRRSGVRQLAAAFVQTSLLAVPWSVGPGQASKLAREKRQQAAALQTGFATGKAAGFEKHEVCATRNSTALISQTL